MPRGVPMLVSMSTRRRRDRRGRGPRHDLLPAQLPGHRSRAQRFDDLVLEAVEHLEERWETQLRDVEFAVEDVPPELPPGIGVELPGLLAAVPDPVPLAQTEPATGTVPPRIVLYRRPLEARSHDLLDLGDLVFDVLVHEVADLLGVDPEVIDPEGHSSAE